MHIRMKELPFAIIVCDLFHALSLETWSTFGIMAFSKHLGTQFEWMQMTQYCAYFGNSLLFFTLKAKAEISPQKAGENLCSDYVYSNMHLGTYQI